MHDAPQRGNVGVLVDIRLGAKSGMVFRRFELWLATVTTKERNQPDSLVGLILENVEIIV